VPVLVVNVLFLAWNLKVVLENGKVFEPAASMV
jgi:hypothetical protein